VVYTQGFHDPHFVVAVDDRHHVVAVDHGAPAAQSGYGRGRLPLPLQPCFLSSSVNHQSDCSSPIVEGIQAPCFARTLHADKLQLRHRPMHIRC
jgi:hypothetical protein